MQLFFKGIVLLAAMIFVSCPGKPAAVSGLTIDRTELNLKLGQEAGRAMPRKPFP